MGGDAGAGAVGICDDDDRGGEPNASAWKE